MQKEAKKNVLMYGPNEMDNNSSWSKKTVTMITTKVIYKKRASGAKERRVV